MKKFNGKALYKKDLSDFKTYTKYSGNFEVTLIALNSKLYLVAK